MAIQAFRREVGTSATLLYAHPKPRDDAGDYGAKNVALINVSGAQAIIYLADSDVAPETGARWLPEAGRTLSVTIEAGESLYGIVDSGTQDVDVLVNGR